MPRQKRVEYEGAVYHVMARGNRSENIVEDVRDREVFVETLQEVVGQTGWEVYSFAIMSNHYHLVFRTPEPNLVKGMTWFQNTLTKRSNARHKRVGHLFAGRYKAIMVEEGEYLRTLIHYVHLNPVKAGYIQPRIEEMRGYLWTSLRDYYFKGSSRRQFIAVEVGLKLLDIPDTQLGRDKLIDWTARLAGKAEDDYTESIRNGWVLGSEKFSKEMSGKLSMNKEDVVNGYGGAQQRGHDEARAREILQQGLKHFKISEEDLKAMKKSDWRKANIAKEIKKKTIMNAEWLSANLYMGNRTGVSKAIRKFKEEANDASKTPRFSA